MALPRARITPTIKEKRYNTINFLEASVIGGNKVKISPVDKYEISELSGEHWTYKEPIETYITFDERPSVQLLRRYGWYREDQTIQPIVAYIPTHLIYDRHILNQYREFHNIGRPPSLERPGYRLAGMSKDRYLIVYINEQTGAPEFFKQSLNNIYIYNYDQGLTNALEQELTPIGLKPENFYFNETTKTVLITGVNIFTNAEENTLIKIIDVNNHILDTYNLPNNIKTRKILGVKYSQGQALIAYENALAIYEEPNYKEILEQQTPDINTVKDFKGQYIIAEYHRLNYRETIIYKVETRVRPHLQRLSTDIETLSFTDGELNPSTTVFTTLDNNNKIRLYRVNNTVLQLNYLIDAGDLAEIDTAIDGTFIYVSGIDLTEPNRLVFKAFEYQDNDFILHSEIKLDTVNYNDLGAITMEIVGDNVLIHTENYGVIAEIEGRLSPDHSKAVANYMLLTGEDIQSLIEFGESEKYILNPLGIKRGTLVDIYYDYIDRQENLFYVTEAKVDTVSINYVAHLMPYKYDQAPEGEAGSNTPLFNTDTRSQKM